jgi:hypothetical protein
LGDGFIKLVKMMISPRIFAQSSMAKPESRTKIRQSRFKKIGEKALKSRSDLQKNDSIKRSLVWLTALVNIPGFKIVNQLFYYWPNFCNG